MLDEIVEIVHTYRVVNCLHCKKRLATSRLGTRMSLTFCTVCPVVRIGPPQPPLPQASVPPPWTQRGGRATLPCGGGGTLFGRLESKPGILNTLWSRGLRKCNAGDFPHGRSRSIAGFRKWIAMRVESDKIDQLIRAYF